MSRSKHKYAIFLGGPNHLQLMPLEAERHINVLFLPFLPAQPREIKSLSTNSLQKVVSVQRAEYIFEGQIELLEGYDKYAIYNFSGYS